MTFTEWRGSRRLTPSMWIKRLIDWRWLGIDIHMMVAADAPGCFHTHPYTALRLVLSGGYVEEMPDGKKKVWLPVEELGVVRPAGFAHRIDSLYNGDRSYSLWIRFRKSAEVELVGDGWGPDGWAKESV